MTINKLTSPITGIIFDCDGTLSCIEGIDELAVINQVSNIVQGLTQEAMGKTGMTPEIYAARMSLTKPSLKQVTDLASKYYHHITPDIETVLAIFRQFKKEIYIISAGLSPAIQLFGKKLQIPPQNIYAVDVVFNSQGDYLDFDRSSPLIKKLGKQSFVEQIRQQNSELGFIGDGLSDLEVAHLVRRFVGYGGAFYRSNIEEQCQFYIKSASILPLLPMLLTQQEVNSLGTEEKQLYQRGLTAMKYF